MAYSTLHVITLNGKELGRMDGDTAQAALCIIARDLAASGHGRPYVEAIPNRRGEKPFGLSYSPSDFEIENWKRAGHHRPLSPNDVADEIERLMC